jgi:nitrite reductase/ring-hydroxylating ferredoxin subunit
MTRQPRRHTTREDLQKKYVVARASDILEGQRLIVDVAGRSIGIFNIEGRFYAFLNRCPHRGAELCKGEVLGLVRSKRPGEWELDSSRKFLVCPWHGWEFDVETGHSWFDPNRMKARPFSIDVESGEVVKEELEGGEAVRPGADVARFVDPVTHRIKGPYEADKIPVTIEDDYIVLSLRRQQPAGRANRAAKEMQT